MLNTHACTSVGIRSKEKHGGVTPHTIWGGGGREHGTRDHICIYVCVYMYIYMYVCIMNYVGFVWRKLQIDTDRP